MTVGYEMRSKNEIRVQKKQISLGLICLFFIFLLLRNAEIAIAYVSQGLTLCAKTLIPSLFPFMVLSELLVASGACDLLFKRISLPLRRLLKISSGGCSALLLGVLCGFPVGARCAALSYEQGYVSREEAERILALSSIPSPAFLISTVGTSLWKSTKFGVVLYLCALLSSIAVGILLGHKRRPTQDRSATPQSINRHPASAARLLCNSVRSALGSILLVCAYVVFFSALLGTLEYFPPVQNLSEAARSILFSAFELSGGISAAASLPHTVTAALITAFAVGWSGFSVLFQILSTVESAGLSMRTYLRSKLLQALLCPLTVGILLWIFPALIA